MEYSNIFGYRKYRAHNHLEDFCNRYYDKDVYNYLIENETKIKNYINNELDDYIEVYRNKGTLHLMTDQVAKLAEHYAGEFFETETEPNGKMKWPDYIINIYGYANIHLDAKCVAYIPRKSNPDKPSVVYHNSCGQSYEITKHILNYYNGIDDPFYLSFVLLMYYNESGYLEDVLFYPMIMAIGLKKFNWNKLSTIKFSSKGAKNSNVTLFLPTFLEKKGMYTLDEKELLIATAAHNYIEKHPEEFAND